MSGKSKQLDGLLQRAMSTSPATSTKPSSTPAGQSASQSEPVKLDVVRAPRQKEVRMQIEVPESVRRAIKARGAESGESTREIVLRALKQDGFDIPEDLIRDRRK